MKISMSLALLSVICVAYLRASELPTALVHELKVQEDSSEGSAGSSPREIESDEANLSSSPNTSRSPFINFLVGAFQAVFGDSDLRDACTAVVDDLPLDNPFSWTATIEKGRRNDAIRAQRSVARKKERERLRNLEELRHKRLEEEREKQRNREEARRSQIEKEKQD